MHPRICQYPPRTLQKLLSRLHKDASTLCLQRSLGQGGRVSAHGLGRGLGGGVGRGPPTPWPRNFWSENVRVTQIKTLKKQFFVAFFCFCGSYVLPQPQNSLGQGRRGTAKVLGRAWRKGSAVDRPRPRPRSSVESGEATQTKKIHQDTHIYV